MAEGLIMNVTVTIDGSMFNLTVMGAAGFLVGWFLMDVFRMLRGR